MKHHNLAMFALLACGHGIPTAEELAKEAERNEKMRKSFEVALNSKEQKIFTTASENLHNSKPKIDVEPVVMDRAARRRARRIAQGKRN